MSRSWQDYGFNPAGRKILDEKVKVGSRIIVDLDLEGIPEVTRQEDRMAPSYTSVAYDEHTAWMDEGTTLYTHTFPDGRVLQDYVQAEPWSSGPCTFMALRDVRTGVPVKETLWTQKEIADYTGDTYIPDSENRINPTTHLVGTTFTMTINSEYDGPKYEATVLDWNNDKDEVKVTLKSAGLAVVDGSDREFWFVLEDISVVKDGSKEGHLNEAEFPSGTRLMIEFPDNTTGLSGSFDVTIQSWDQNNESDPRVNLAFNDSTLSATDDGWYLVSEMKPLAVLHTRNGSVVLDLQKGAPHPGMSDVVG